MCSIAILGIALSVGGSLIQGQQQAQMVEMQARAYEQQAQADAQASAYEAEREKRKQELAAAASRAQVGASGVALEGSPTEVLLANAREAEMDISAIKYGSQLRQNQLQTQAAISRFSGKQAKVAGFINAGSNLIGGISNLYDPNRATRLGRSAFA
jgi:hypothetical protein